MMIKALVLFTRIFNVGNMASSFQHPWWLPLLRHSVMSTWTSIRKHVMRELHGEGCGGYLARDKSSVIVEDCNFRPHLKTNVTRKCELCWVCQLAKGQRKNMELYWPPPIPHEAWQDLSMDFVLGLPKTAQKVDSIFVVIDRFSKTAHFIQYSIIVDAMKIATLFFKEVVRLHGQPKRIMSAAQIQSSWATYGRHGKWCEKLQFPSAYHPQTNCHTEVVNRSLRKLLWCFSCRAYL